MRTLRVFFEKTGRASYISHLDLSRTVQRALKRAELPVWYTEGFNPHIYLTFALPLSLGYEGLAESFDVRVTDDIDARSFATRLNDCMPEGLRATGAGEPVMKPGKITFASYTIALDMAGIANPLDALAAFLSQPTIEVEKTGKKTKGIVDIKPHIKAGHSEIDGGIITLSLTLPAGGQMNINPGLFVTGFMSFLDSETTYTKITRTALYDENMEVFK